MRSQIHLVNTVTYFVNRSPGNCTAGTAQRAAVYRQVRSRDGMSMQQACP